MQYKALNYQAETSHDIYPFLVILDEYITGGNYKAIEDFYWYHDFTKISTTILMSIMRTTYQWANKISNYNDTLLKIANVIDSRGEDSTRVLRGLNKPFNNLITPKSI
jgi:hypothetical protein